MGVIGNLVAQRAQVRSSSAVRGGVNCGDRRNALFPPVRPPPVGACADGPRHRRADTRTRNAPVFGGPHPIDNWQLVDPSPFEDYREPSVVRANCSRARGRGR